MQRRGQSAIRRAESHHPIRGGSRIMPVMLIALTGASGFIGSHIARALHEAGHELRALVRSTSRRDHIQYVVDEFRVGELDDPQVLAGLVAGVDCVVHNGVDWDAVRAAPIKCFERNVMGSLRLLESARQAGVKQFIFISSVAVHHEMLTEQFNGRIDETHPTWPGGIYGAYKAAIESHLKAYHHTYEMNTSAWRPAAVYGIDPKIERSQWYELIRKARDGGHIANDKGGKITHVQDIADAVTLAVGDEEVAGQFYNLAERYMYWQRAAEFAREISGSSATIENLAGSGPKNQFETGKAIAFFDRHGNSTALRRGEAGVREYVGELLKAMD